MAGAAVRLPEALARHRVLPAAPPDDLAARLAYLPGAALTALILVVLVTAVGAVRTLDPRAGR